MDTFANPQGLSDKKFLFYNANFYKRCIFSTFTHIVAKNERSPVLERQTPMAKAKQTKTKKTAKTTTVKAKSSTAVKTRTKSTTKAKSKPTTKSKKATTKKTTPQEIELLNETGRRKALVAPKVERRKRRRQIDPTTCEREYSDPEIQFMHAMDEYKRASGRMFPTCSEILEVLTKLGYRQIENPEELMYDPNNESGKTEEELWNEDLQADPA